MNMKLVYVCTRHREKIYTAKHSAIHEEMTYYVSTSKTVMTLAISRSLDVQQKV